MDRPADLSGWMAQKLALLCLRSREEKEGTAAKGGTPVHGRSVASSVADYKRPLAGWRRHYQASICASRLQKYHLGSVVVATHTYRQGLLRASPLEAARVANQLQADSKLPVLLAADLERGLTSPLKDVPDFPWPMALGAVDDPADAEQVARTSAFGVRGSSDDDDKSRGNWEGCPLYI